MADDGIPEMRVELVVLGGEAFSPYAFQAALGLTADEINLIGEKIGTSILRHQKNAWTVSTGYLKCIYLDQCAAPLMVRLAPYWDGLRELTAPPGIHVEFSVTAYVESVMPALSLKKCIIEKVAYIGAAIDVDIILLGSGAREVSHGEP